MLRTFLAGSIPAGGGEFAAAVATDELELRGDDGDHEIARAAARAAHAGGRRVTADLAGRRIAITRPDVGAVGRLLVELGATVVHVPLIEVGDPPDGGVALASALARLASFDWMVVTSANGARRVGPAAAAHPDLRLAAVGAAHGDRARRAGRAAGRPRARRAARRGSARRAAAGPGARARPPGRPGGPGAGRRPGRRGFAVEVVHAYATVSRTPTPAERSALAGVDAVVFASGSAATAWIEAGGLAAPPVVIAIGPSTERVARAAGLAVTHVAPDPTPATIVAVLVGALG